MSFKLVGAALILIAGYGVSLVLNSKESSKAYRLVCLCRLLRFFRLQIDCYCAPIGEIFARVDADILQGCGCRAPVRDLDTFIGSLDPPPDGKVRELLCSLASELGSGYREDQLKCCDYHLSLITPLAEAATLDAARRKRLNTVLCLAAAAATVILLI